MKQGEINRKSRKNTLDKKLGECEPLCLKDKGAEQRTRTKRIKRA